MADFTEAQLFSALGVAAPGGEGGNVQEPATPATQDPNMAQADEGGNEQEPAVPASEGATTTPDTTTEDPQAGEDPKSEGADGEEEPPAEDGQEGAADDKQPLTPEQRKANAAQRRRAEQQAIIDKAVQDAVAAEQAKSKQEMDAFFAAANLKNSITGEPITNMEQFRAWKEAFETAKLQRDLKSGKLTPEGLNKVISDNPIIKRAQEIISKDEEAQKRQQLEVFKAKADAEIAEIHKLDPSISDVKDLLKMPNAKEFYALVKRGYTYFDAFWSVNRERLENRTAEAAKQQALNNARNKGHLTATGNARGAGALNVPKDELDMFKLLNPGASEAEIQAYYNKVKKG